MRGRFRLRLPKRRDAEADVVRAGHRWTPRTIHLLATGVAALTAWSATEVVARTGESAVRLVPRASHGGFHPIAGNFARDDTRVAECDGEDLPCLQQGFGNIAFDRGPTAALAAFDERIAADTTIRRRCHPIAHAIGSAALARYGGDVAKAFAEGSASCASGYYHGLLERAFVGASGEKEMVRRARSLCRGLRERGFLEYQCVHGLGHGLMIQTGYDLPASLTMCDRLDTGWDRTSCTGGVFMENTSTAFGFRSRWLKQDDLVYPCNWVEDRYRRSCYLRVTTRILEASEYDWERTARLCQETGEWARFCFRSYGRDASGHVGHEPKQVLELCKIAGAGEPECLYGAARTIADTYADGSRAAPLCEIASETHRDACFSGLGLVVGLLEPSNSARRTRCAELATTHVNACVSGARAEVAASGRGAWG